MTKRIATNSMLNVAKRCRRQYNYAYLEEIAPARQARAPSFGSLFHRLYNELLVKGEAAQFDLVLARWRTEQMETARAHEANVKAAFGYDDPGILTSAEERVAELGAQALALIEFYRTSVWVKERDEYRVLFAEQTFNVPLLDRAGSRHKTWRFSGRWDLVVQSLATGRVLLRDVKTTSRFPADFATLAELDTQPVAYFYAARYLASRKRPALTSLQLTNGVARQAMESLGGDAPFWPQDWPAPSGFEHEVIRKKVPQAPQPIKDGTRLSKQITDTTPELFRAAIAQHGFNEADYADILDRLDRKGPMFHFRQEVNLGEAEIRRWLEETRMTLEDVAWFERNRDRAYRADPHTCQSTWGKRCIYHALCYGDEELARADFVSRSAHAELEDEPEEVRGGPES